MSPILLDTHAAIWIADGRLHLAASKAVDSAAERAELLLSPISAWEIGMLVCKGRLPLNVPVHEYIRELFSQSGLVTAAITPAVAAAAALLPESLRGDPADRIIVATAQEYAAALVTRDEKILAFAKASKSLRCIAC